MRKAKNVANFLLSVRKVIHQLGRNEKEKFTYLIIYHFYFHSQEEGRKMKCAKIRWQNAEEGELCRNVYNF